VRQNLRVALVEAGDLDKVRNWHMPPDKYSNRVSSLTNASCNFLKSQCCLSDFTEPKKES
jgi:ubiquinone biosynthesis monooxygenase Coq6